MHRILVVDDEPAVREVLCKLLTREGYAVEQAGNGLDALRIHSKDPVDLAVLDIFMPEMDGLEIITALQKHGSTVKIIAASGGGASGNLDFLDIAEHFGAHATFQKPFRSDDLLRAIRDLLGDTDA